MKKFFNFVIAVGIFLFSSQVDAKTFEGVGEYIGSYKETPEFAVKNATLYAERDALSKAGIFISSLTEVKKNQLRKDEIVTFTAGIIKSHVINTEPISLTGEAQGWIKYRVTVSADIDENILSNEINNWKNRNSKEKEVIVSKNNEIQKIVDEQKQKISAIENQKNIQTEIKNINQKTAQAAALDEGNKFYYQGDYKKAVGYYLIAMLEEKGKEAIYFYGRSAIKDLGYSSHQNAIYARRNAVLDGYKEINAECTAYIEKIAKDVNISLLKNDVSSLVERLQIFSETFSDAGYYEIKFQLHKLDIINWMNK